MIVQLEIEDGLIREELAYIDVSVIEHLYSSTDDVKFSLEKCQLVMYAQITVVMSL